MNVQRRVRHTLCPGAFLCYSDFGYGVSNMVRYGAVCGTLAGGWGPLHSRVESIIP